MHTTNPAPTTPLSSIPTIALRPSTWSAARRRDISVASIIGLASWIMYWRTLTHGLLVDDSAEFQTMARLFGHTHPTGYEVYILVAGSFARIPIGDIATRVTAFSALSAALVVGGVYLVVRQLGAGRVASAMAAGALAVSSTFWSQAVIAEVYTPALLLAVVVFGSVLRWDATGDRRWLWVTGGAFGLSLGVHFTNGLMVPAALVFMAMAGRKHFGHVFGRDALRQMWGPTAAAAVAGIVVAVAAFLLIDFSNPPNQYFDAVISPSASAWDLESSTIDGGFERLRFDWTGRQFQGQAFADPSELMPVHWANFRSGLPNEFSLLGLALAAVGVVAVGWRSLRQAAFAVVMLVSSLGFALNYDVDDVYVFYLPSYLVMAVLFGVGLDTVARGMHKLTSSRPVLATATVAVVGLAALAPVSSPRATHVVDGTPPAFAFDSYPTESDVQLIAAATVASLPADAVVLTDWDLLYTYVYVSQVELGRNDLVFHETKPADDSDDLADSLFDHVRTTARDRPVFLSGYANEFRAAGFQLSPARIGPARLFRVSSEQQ